MALSVNQSDYHTMFSAMGMHKIFMTVFGFLLLTSCAEKREGELKPGLLSNLVSISDNEDDGVKKVLSFYGGYYKYAIGASASTEQGKKKYFEKEIQIQQAYLQMELV